MFKLFQLNTKTQIIISDKSKRPFWKRKAPIPNTVFAEHCIYFLFCFVCELQGNVNSSPDSQLWLQSYLTEWNEKTREINGKL